ncbi:MAG TPA: YfbM family protein [Terracidiphilus sp.]|nr:YfbM family protein [Terracidiphilus sp.]
MSMNAVFVQVDSDSLARIEADPSLAEALFQDGPAMPPAFLKLNETMEQRVRDAGPQMMARVLSQLDPRLRERLEQRLGQSASSLAAGQGGEQLLKLMQQRREHHANRPSIQGSALLSLDKEWHGVHYLLCGEIEAGSSLLSQAVLGGRILGDDDEGFSGYGAARGFRAGEVAEISAALSAPDVEQRAASRFDAARMNALKIYPGWKDSGAEPAMDALRRLRDFYSDAAGKNNGIVTCLV